MKKNISILIPCYNHVCMPLVRVLHEMAEQTVALCGGPDYEIIVADDGSTDETCVCENRAINRLPHCRLLENGQNVGRAEIRNVLARAARYDWLVFLDCDVKIAEADFLLTYLKCDEKHDVVYGGICLPQPSPRLRHNLRYRYEKNCLPKFSVENRRAHPYQSFRTCNFMVCRQTLLDHPFDAGIRTYGYEDVLFGKALTAAQIPVHHIFNPVEIDDFEDNEIFLKKTEEAMQTLFKMRLAMNGYSLITSLAEKIKSWHLRRPLLFVFKILSPFMRSNLCGKHPSVRLYNAYRMLYYLRLE